MQFHQLCGLIVKGFAVYLGDDTIGFLHNANRITENRLTEYTEHPNSVASPRFHVAIELVEAIADYLNGSGHCADAFFLQQSFSFEEEGQNGYVSMKLFSDLFDAAARYVEDDYLGLKVGSNFLAKHWGRLGYLVMAGENGLEAVQYLQRFASIVTNGIELHWHTEGDGFRCEFALLEAKVSRHVLDYLVSSSYAMSKATSENQVRYNQLDFCHDGGPKPEVYSELFACPCQFNQPRNQILLDLAFLQQLSAFRDPRLKTILEAHAQQVLQDLSSGDEWLSQVQSAILAALPDGTPSMKRVADQFGQNERSFQRTLAKHNVNFQELVDELRKRLALEYIKNDYNFLDIAMMLGYSEQSAFHRAFKRWTGQTPSKYRRNPDA